MLRYLARSPFDDRYFTTGPTVNMVDSSAFGTMGALKVSTVWRAINVMAAAVAVLPVDVFRRKGKRGWEPAEGAPFRTQLRLMPNRIQTSYRWRYHLVGHLMLSGNYYAHKHEWEGPPDRMQLRPLAPERVKPQRVRPDGSLEYQYTRASGEPVSLGQDELVHVRGFTLDGVTGLSVLDLMRDHVSLATSNRQSRTQFMKNAMRPAVVVSFAKPLSEPEERHIQQGYVRAFGAPSRAGLPLVIGDGGDVKPFAINSREAQYVESEHFLVEEFLRFTGVPGVLVGYADKTSTYASAESFFQSFVTHCVWPIVGNLEQELTTSLYGVQEDVRVRFNLNALLRADSTARAAFYRALVELGIFTRNEIRDLEERNPLDGLDEPLTPMNMGGAVPERGSGGAPPPARPTRPPDQGDKDDDDDEGEETRASRAWVENPEDGRARAIAEAAADHVIRREVVAILGDAQSGALQARRGAAARYAKNPPGWREWATTFYAAGGPHATMVARALSMRLEVADRYCAEQRDALLTHGLPVVATWPTTRARALLNLALTEG